MSNLIASAAGVLAPWANLYGDSKLVATGVTFAHIGGLLLGGGCAVAGDRMSLRFRSIEPICQHTHLEELAALHRPVVIGLTVTLVSGLLLLAADLETFLRSPVFWAKMVFIGVLLLNGVQLQRAEQALRQDPARPEYLWWKLRRAALQSLLLWFSATIFGTALLAI